MLKIANTVWRRPLYCFFPVRYIAGFYTFLISLVFFASVPANAVTINEFATAAADSAPQGIAAGPDGNLWVTEYFGNKIGRTTPAGVITEFTVPTAGSGPLGIAAGPDGNLWFTLWVGNKIGRIATAGVITEFTIPTANSYPECIAAGPDGNLWFTEYYGNKIGRITTDGVITEYPVPTVAGDPAEIATGPDGNLWFAENNNNKIGRITPAGVITEFTTPTGNSHPFGITAGPDGNLWFTEELGNNIGRITPVGAITEYAVPTAGSYPFGIAAGPDGNLWFAEGVGTNIGRVTPAGVISEYAVPTAGSDPGYIATGPDGNLWFTESYGSKIGQILLAAVPPSPHSISGVISYTGSAQGTVYVLLFSSPNQTSDSQALYSAIADASGYYGISGIPDGTYYVEAVKTQSLNAPSLTDPYGIYTQAVTINGVNAQTGINITLVDGTVQNPDPLSNNNVTLTITETGTGAGIVTPGAGTITWAGKTGTGLYSANTPVTLLATASSGSGFGSWSGCDSVSGNNCMVTMTAGRIVTATFMPIVNGACGSNNGANLAAAPTTNLCSAGTPSSVAGGSGLWIWNCNGAYTGTNASCTAAAITINEFAVPTSGSYPFVIASGPDGNLWFTEWGGNNIGQITPAGVIKEYTVPTLDSWPWGITAGPDGNLWFTEGHFNNIVKITPAGVITEYTDPTAESSPEGITAGPDGNLWFVEGGGNKIGRITPAGIITEYPLPTADSWPWGITSGPDGNLWFTEGSGNNIGRITPAGVITEYRVPTAESSPEGITAGPDGNLWFAEGGGNNIGRITPAGVITEYRVPTAESGPEGITAGPDGNLWFTEYSGNNIGRITPAGVITEYQLPTTDGTPEGITVGPDGNFWFTESYSNKIGQLVLATVPPSPDSISGTISYTGSAQGTVYVSLFNSPNPRSDGQALYSTIANASGYYGISGIPDGTYYVEAVKTQTINAPSYTDPYGIYAPAVTINSVNAQTGINITLADGTVQAPDPFSRKLIVTVAGTGAGNITSGAGAITWSGSTGTGLYSANTSVTLTATPSADSTFNSWNGCDSVNVNSCTVTMTVDRNVTATFIAIVNGACGSSNNVDLTSAPTTGLCSTGTPTTVSGNGPWTWTCQGSNSGTNANCTANLSQSVGYCTYSLSPSGQSFGYAGGTGSVVVSSSDSCTPQAWTAAANESWITVTSVGNTSGDSCTVTFSVSANEYGGSERAGAITIAGQTFSVTQAVQTTCTTYPVMLELPTPEYFPTLQSAFAYIAASGGNTI